MGRYQETRIRSIGLYTLTFITRRWICSRPTFLIFVKFDLLIGFHLLIHHLSKVILSALLLQWVCELYVFGLLIRLYHCPKNFLFHILSSSSHISLFMHFLRHLLNRCREGHSFQVETTQKNVFTTQKATEELFLATRKSKSTTQKPLTTTQNLYTFKVFS